MTDMTTMTDLLTDKRFPVIDVALRKGIHFTEDDIDSYKFLVEARDPITDFYGKYGAELIYDPEGYVFLAPKEGVFRQGRLKPGEMVLGQVLALFTTDPRSLRDGGKIKVEDILLRLMHLLPTDQLASLFYAQRKRKSRTDIDEKKFKETAEKYLRTLCSLGFATWTKDGYIRPFKSVYRFTPFARTTAKRENVQADLEEKELITVLDEVKSASDLEGSYDELDMDASEEATPNSDIMTSDELNEIENEISEAIH